MLGTTSGVRTLGPDDLPALRALVHEDPIVNLFVEHRIEATQLQPRWLGGEIWGFHRHGRLVSACHVAANFVAVQATDEALDAFGRHAETLGRTSSSIVGLQHDVVALWQALEPSWGPARSLRMDQPFLVADRAPDVAPDPRVRRVLIDELEVLYPASVAMFTEEVGESPELHGRHSYRARVAQLISRGWAFAIIEDGAVLFKAEVGAATSYGCQVQGVYVHPDLRGQGLASRAMASVVRLARRDIAPAVSLYVNHHNVAARKAYERSGFSQRETFASILF
ncbi:GNAT family N-acetyltransferase [Solicola gregarius]|uniref:GNAT family N-acetyltransferase n=1 Tax=Solicola gregarius TaxID=2908642 RepID=A0AA46YJL8_9ACTN|nr:GNAT family N-acetyltransferase [Solicola gregarius]UYM04467.1 GNAT family N-acetyltransferase [Solicola gregarius]